MKKIIDSLALMILLSLFFPSFASAQGMMDMMGQNNPTEQIDDGHTAREETEGKEIWEKLQNKEVNCEDLSDEDFQALGEYFMGQMAGEQHEAMNNMMITMMGAEGEKQMHIAMGKRMTGCESNAPIPQTMMSGGMMPMMMSMMMGRNDNSMMGGFGISPMAAFGWSFGSWLVILVLLVWLVVGVLAAIWLAKQIKK